MLAIFESLLPIFALIVLGYTIKRSGFIAEDAWGGMEKLGYYVFFPALLIPTLYRADFGELSATGAALGFFVGIMVLMGILTAVRRPVQAVFSLSSGSYTSLFQGISRWNAFIALAIAERLFGPEGLTIVAIGIGAMIIPINIVNVFVLIAHGEKEGEMPPVMQQIITNPLIVAVVVGLLMKFSNLPVYGPLETFIDLLGRISLPLGIILVGAGLRLRMPGSEAVAVAFATAVRLLAVPLLLVGVSMLFGVRGNELTVIALCGGVPTAMNGYLLAKQMGGDAPLMASIVTAQTLFSFLTIPLVLQLVQLFG